MNNTVITTDLLESALGYDSYKKLILELLDQNKVTGDFMDNNDWIVNYSKENITRMAKGDANVKLLEALETKLAAVEEKWTWVVITEGWCGDASQIVPIFVKLAAINPKHEIKFIFRDENPTVMEQYLTNGSKSIPKIAVFNEALEEVMVWGPRPAYAQQMTLDYNAKKDISFGAYIKKLHEWYNQDEYQSVQKEVLEQLG